MSQQRVNITSPVGRIVMGSLYDPQTTDADGKPLVIKNGANAGQPRSNYFIALAIPKGPERHWAETPWGSQIWAVGHQAFPQAAQSPAFAWKVDDGDSAVPNMKGRKNCDNEGWPGHWILKLSGGFAPKVYQQNGNAYEQVVQKDFVKPGYYVEIAFNVEGNGSQQKPGVYLNHSMVCFRGYGQEISFGPDVNAAGFGQSPMPVGASATPLAGAIPPPVGAASPVGVTPPGIVPPPAAMAPPAIPVVPNVGFVQVPPPGGVAPPAAIPAIPAAPVAPVRQMTALAAGATYESFIVNGWTDALLVQHGYMLP